VRLLIFVVLICGTAHTNHAHAGAIRKALVGTGIVTGIAVGSAIVSEEIGAAVVAALIAAKIGIDTDAYSNAITDLKMVLALHRIVGKHLANKALNNEVKKDPSLADIANQVRADAGLSKSRTIEQVDSRSIPMPEEPRRGCTCTCRADANDNIPGNIEPGMQTFAFGTATASSCAQASKDAKREATHSLGMQPKHIDCRCAGK